MSILEIKKKIGGVKNTKKITKAMQLVAASKMQQFQRKAQSTRSFSMDLIKSLYNQCPDQKSKYTTLKDTPNTLFVLYTSDKGLCGPLNTKLINTLFRSNKWNDLPPENQFLITIGKKATEYARTRKIEAVATFPLLPERLDSIDALDVIDVILDAYETKNISRVYFICPHYHNSFTNYPVVKQFLPFSKEMISSHLESKSEEEVANLKSAGVMSYYPQSPSLVLDHMYRQIVSALFMQAFMELKASEYSNRMIAMKNATDSADNMIKDLTRTYNKARQGAITQEIAELIGARAAME